ncbi:MAG TPA: hypothetical protein VMD91_16190 [Candidatus Sulfotelmatobacter sp.]|nr:hypothetical protein [Candidatus Sulfotelmatobacter sp.]
MLDLVGALALSAAMVVAVAVVVGSAAISRQAKLVAFALAAAWFAILAAVGSAGVTRIGPVPFVPLAFVLAVVAGALAWTTGPRFRAALRSVPLVALVGANGVRVAGVFFLVLYAQHRLPAPFAQSAGIGDIVTGLGALALVAYASRGGTVSPRLLAAWNAFGALDLVVAMTLGVVSQPGLPIQLFGASASAITALPWMLIPTALVPFLLLTHLAIAARLAAPSAQPVAFAR